MVTTEEGATLAKNEGLDFFETSAAQQKVGSFHCGHVGSKLALLHPPTKPPTHQPNPPTHHQDVDMPFHFIAHQFHKKYQETVKKSEQLSAAMM